MSGWIKIHRSITNHWLYSEKRTYSKLEAWYDMLMTVNYTDNKVLIKGNLYNVKRGQSILSLESWGKRWNWDKSKVRRFLNTLQTDNMIELKSDTITTQLTICNYESYQGERNADETRTKRKRNADETQTNLIEERKKENKEIHIPEYSEFLKYAISQVPNVIQLEVKLKYDSWVVNGWKDGNDKKIVNWKSKLNNTLPHLKQQEFKQPRIIID